MIEADRELMSFGRESKRISNTYNLSSLHSECFVANHGDSDGCCNRCSSKTECLLIKQKEDERKMRETLYTKCNGCPYYYGEVDVCMFGEKGVPDNLQKKCNPVGRYWQISKGGE